LEGLGKTSLAGGGGETKIITCIIQRPDTMRVFCENLWGTFGWSGGKSEMGVYMSGRSSFTPHVLSNGAYAL